MYYYIEGDALVLTHSLLAVIHPNLHDLYISTFSSFVFT